MMMIITFDEMNSTTAAVPLPVPIETVSSLEDVQLGKLYTGVTLRVENVGQRPLVWENVTGEFDWDTQLPTDHGLVCAGPVFRRTFPSGQVTTLGMHTRSRVIRFAIPVSNTTAPMFVHPSRLVEIWRVQNSQITPHDNCGVRVKDVFRVKGHACEIPLEAYRRAGVAERETDYVSDAQIEKASAMYDGMGVADDVNTQWGNVPGGVHVYK